MCVIEKPQKQARELHSIVQSMPTHLHTHHNQDWRPKINVSGFAMVRKATSVVKEELDSTSYMLLTPTWERNAFSFGCARMSFCGTHVVTCNARWHILAYPTMSMRSKKEICTPWCSRWKRHCRRRVASYTGTWWVEGRQEHTFVLLPRCSSAIAAPSGTSLGVSLHSTLHGSCANVAAINTLCSCSACNHITLSYQQIPEILYKTKQITFAAASGTLLGASLYSILHGCCICAGTMAMNGFHTTQTAAPSHSAQSVGCIFARWL